MTQQTQQQVQLRKVTEVHAIVTQPEPEADCTCTYQFILDNGIEERIWQLKEGDADQIQDMLLVTDDVHYDAGRNALIFKDIHDSD